MIRQTHEQHSERGFAATTDKPTSEIQTALPSNTNDERQPTDHAEAMMTQEQLTRFQQLTNLLAERDQLRRKLLDLLAAGAPIEPGPLSPRVKVHRSHRFSHRNLRELLGDDGVEWMLTQIEPTLSAVLKVCEDQSGDTDET